jgi:tripartite-type tricarboxylate transporter receptor subunit TctC
MAPAATPPAIVATLNAEIVKVVDRPDIRATWAKQGAEPMAMSPAAFDAFLRADIEKWAKVVKISGAKVD